MSTVSRVMVYFKRSEEKPEIKELNWVGVYNKHNC